MKLLSESGISPKLTVGLSDIVMKLSVHLKATYFRLLESALSPTQLADMKQQARYKAEQEFGIESMMRQTHQLYQRVM